MVWTKGKSGNPAGYPKQKRIWKEAIERAIKRREASNPRALRLLADKLIMKIRLSSFSRSISQCYHLRAQLQAIDNSLWRRITKRLLVFSV